MPLHKNVNQEDLIISLWASPIEMPSNIHNSTPIVIVYRSGCSLRYYRKSNPSLSVGNELFLESKNSIAISDIVFCMSIPFFYFLLDYFS